MARRRRVLRSLGVGLVLLVGVVAAALVVLSTPPGGALLRRIAVGRVNATIAGSLAVERVRWRGGRVVLEGVVLRDPQGAAVAALDRLDVSVSLRALLARRIQVQALALERPRLWLASGRNGSNLAVALAL